MPTLRPFREWIDEIAALPRGECRWLPENEWPYNEFHKGHVPQFEMTCPSCGHKTVIGTTGIILDNKCGGCQQRLNPTFRDEKGHITFSAAMPNEKAF